MVIFQPGHARVLLSKICVPYFRTLSIHDFNFPQSFAPYPPVAGCQCNCSYDEWCHLCHEMVSCCTEPLVKLSQTETWGQGPYRRASTNCDDLIQKIWTRIQNQWELELTWNPFASNKNIISAPSTPSGFRSAIISQDFSSFTLNWPGRRWTKTSKKMTLIGYSNLQCLSVMIHCSFFLAVSYDKPSRPYCFLRRGFQFQLQSLKCLPFWPVTAVRYNLRSKYFHNLSRQ